jgi:hypothetical protein
MFALSKLFSGLEMPLTPYFLLLIAWPVALAVVLWRPQMRRIIGDTLPVAQDRGFEGVALLMTLFGVVGSLVMLFILLAFLKAGGALLATPYGFILFAMVVMLLARAITQAHAGITGIRGLDSPDPFSTNAARYYNFGVVSSVIVAGALMVMSMLTGFAPSALLLVGTVAYWLLAWPLSLRRFFVERNFSAYLAGDKAPTFSRSPDAGLTALGWLLLASSVIALAANLPALWIEHGREAIDAGMLSMFSLPQATGSSPWLPVGMAGLQLWAAIELITMSGRSRAVASLYGLAGTIVTIYLNWPIIKALDQGGLGGLFSSRGDDPFSMISMLAIVALSLVVPLGTLLLANRPQSAQARVFERDRPMSR